jgi:hypothetical protein
MTRTATAPRARRRAAGAMDLSSTGAGFGDPLRTPPAEKAEGEALAAGLDYTDRLVASADECTRW